MKLSRASKLTVWRTVQKLMERGLVLKTDKTKPAANGLGGRGSPAKSTGLPGVGRSYRRSQKIAARTRKTAEPTHNAHIPNPVSGRASFSGRTVTVNL